MDPKKVYDDNRELLLKLLRETQEAIDDMKVAIEKIENEKK